MMARRFVAVLGALCAFSLAPAARAFPHVVMPGESLASIAARVYGDAKAEAVLAAANGLDVQGGVAPPVGMRLELPAPRFHRVVAGDTWPELAKRFYGREARSDVLARANGAVPWVPPDRGAEVLVPYVLAVVAGDADRLDTVAKRFWGDPNRAWEVAIYNGRKDEPLRRGDVLLIPLPDLKLTEAGKAEQRDALRESGAADGSMREAQQRVDADVRAALGLLRAGAYLEVVQRTNRALGTGVAVARQEAALLRALLEALVALDASEAAADACARWRAVDKDARLDPVRTSPKVRAACSGR